MVNTLIEQDFLIKLVTSIYFINVVFIENNVIYEREDKERKINERGVQRLLTFIALKSLAVLKL